jgi:SET domain/MYND finger
MIISFANGSNKSRNETPKTRLIDITTQLSSSACFVARVGEMERTETTAWFCDACGKVKYQHAALLKCGQCGRTFYHDKTCQKKHWPHHKANCHKKKQPEAQPPSSPPSSSSSQEDALLVPPEAPLLLQQKFEVIETTDKGRCVVALCDLLPGDVVLLEPPALVLDTRLEYIGMFQAFGHASKELQHAILQLQQANMTALTHTVMTRERQEKLEQQRLVYDQRYPHHSITKEISRKLWAIVECNGVQLFNYNTNDSNDHKQQQWMGLFRQGSMVEHSCNPNLTMNTTQEGYLELIAECTIAKGTRLSFSYMEGIYEKTREQRQDLLLQEKHFLCHCTKCIQGLEECRPIIIPQQLSSTNNDPIFFYAKHNGYVQVQHTLDKNETKVILLTQLAKDDPTLQPWFKTELEFSQTIQNLEHSLEHGILSFPVVMTKLSSLMTSSSWKSSIHSLHWLNVSACHFLSQATSAVARMMMMQQPQRHGITYIVSLLRLSVLALLHNMTWVERMVGMLRQPSEENNSNNDSTTALGKIVMADQTSGGDGSNATVPSQIMTLLQSALANFVFTDEGMVSPQHLAKALSIVCSTTTTPAAGKDESVTADSLLTAFYAGQDLLLAGHVDLCLILYQRYQTWFHKLKQPSAENRTRIDLLLSSQGRINPFANILL